MMATPLTPISVSPPRTPATPANSPVTSPATSPRNNNALPIPLLSPRTPTPSHAPSELAAVTAACSKLKARVASLETATYSPLVSATFEEQIRDMETRHRRELDDLKARLERERDTKVESLKSKLKQARAENRVLTDKSTRLSASLEDTEADMSDLQRQTAQLVSVSPIVLGYLDMKLKELEQKRLSKVASISMELEKLRKLPPKTADQKINELANQLEREMEARDNYEKELQIVSNALAEMKSRASQNPQMSFSPLVLGLIEEKLKEDNELIHKKEVTALKEQFNAEKNSSQKVIEEFHLKVARLEEENEALNDEVSHLRSVLEEHKQDMPTLVSAESSPALKPRRLDFDAEDYGPREYHGLVIAATPSEQIQQIRQLYDTVVALTSEKEKYMELLAQEKVRQAELDTQTSNCTMLFSPLVLSVIENNQKRILKQSPADELQQLKEQMQAESMAAEALLKEVVQLRDQLSSAHEYAADLSERYFALAKSRRCFNLFN